MTPPTRPWHDDPLEVDRYLDGEGTPAERSARAAAAGADPEISRRLGARAAFLTALRRAAPAPVADPAFEERIRAALSAAARSTPASAPSGRLLSLRRGLAAAAVLLLGLGAVSVLSPSREATALHPADLAARLLSWQPRGGEGAEGCEGREVLSFALVRQGELLVRGCAPAPEGAEPGASVAVLTRPEELPVVGYVAVPAPGSVGGTEVGLTEVDDGRVVVFDVLDHGRRVYLAVDAKTLRAKSGTAPHAWTCAACHGPERQSLPNPHPMVLRRAR